MKLIVIPVAVARIKAHTASHRLDENGFRNVVHPVPNVGERINILFLKQGRTKYLLSFWKKLQLQHQRSSSCFSKLCVFY